MSKAEVYKIGHRKTKKRIFSVNLGTTLQNGREHICEEEVCLPCGISAKREEGAQGQRRLKKGKEGKDQQNYNKRACESRDFILTNTFLKGKARDVPLRQST